MDLCIKFLLRLALKPYLELLNLSSPSAKKCEAHKRITGECMEAS